MRKTWESSRLIYRAVETDDEAFLKTLQNDPEAFLNATHFLATPPGKSNAAKWRERLQEKNMLGVIICLKAPEPDSEDETRNQPIPIGTVELSAAEAQLVQHRNCMLGIYLSNKYHGKGYGSEAIQWAVRWGFLYANMHRIEIMAFSWNPRAIALYERLGFVPEGIYRECLWFEGKYRDVHALAMLKPEWEARYGSCSIREEEEGKGKKIEG